MNRVNAAGQSEKSSAKAAAADANIKAVGKITSLKANAVDEGDERQEALIRSVVEGRRAFHKIPGDLSPEVAVSVRRRSLEEMPWGLFT